MFPQIPRQGPGMQSSGAGFGGRPSMFGMNQSPMMGMGGPQQMNSGGGLFSRLLGMRNPTGGMGMGNPAGRMGGGLMGLGNQAGRMGRGLMGMGNQAGRAGLMGLQQAGRAAGAGGSGGIMNFLNNTQQFLRTAQSIGPMVQQFQQYGSLVKNLPAMWRLYRGFKSIPNDSDASTEDQKKTSSSATKAGKTQSKGSSNSAGSSSKVSNSQREHARSSAKGKSSKSKSAKSSKNRVTWKKDAQTTSAKGSSSPKLYI